jgi:hypothetical protein
MLDTAGHHVAAKRVANFTDAIGIFNHPDVARIAKVVHNRFVVHASFLLYLYISIIPGLSGILS